MTGHLYGAKINKLKKLFKFSLKVGIVLSIISSVLLIGAHTFIFPIISEGILKINQQTK